MMLLMVKRIANQPSLSRTLLNSVKLVSSDVSSTPSKLSQEKIDEAANKLENLVSNFKYFTPRAAMFAPDIELEDEIMDKQIKGLAEYQIHAMKYLFYINWTYNGFTIKSIDVVKNLKEGSVDIKWHLYGKPGWYLTLIADMARSFRKSNEEKRDEWDAMEGLSRFYLNEKGLISRQILKVLKRGCYRDIVRKSIEK